MGVKIYLHKMLKESRSENEINALLRDFREYKEKGILPARFGRDETYERPSSAKMAELMHIHINEGKGWPLKIVQFHRTSDDALVYCPGWHSKDNYLLITYLTNAHARAKKITFMCELADIAEKFRSRY